MSNRGRFCLAAFFLSFVLASCSSVPEPDPRFGVWLTLFDGKQSLQDDWFISRPENETVGWNWKVESDGSMTNVADASQGKHNIATTRKFHNFELYLEFKISKGGNAGVYLRGRCEIQIKDTHGQGSQGVSDMGALYKYLAPRVDATRPAGEWNQLYVRLIGNRLTASLNGELIHDNVFARGTGAGGQRPGPFDAPHMLELQGDHEQVWFRNVRIRPLFESPGWREVFNRKDVSEWFPAHQAGNERSGGEMKWIVQDGVITNTAEYEPGDPDFHGVPDVLSKETFENYLLHYEYKSHGNAGFFLRDLWEIQIVNSAGEEPTKHTDGALYALYAPLVNMSNPVGMWNTVDVKLEGRKVTAFHNGVLIHDNRECYGRTFAPTDATNMDRPGYFRLQGDHGAIWFTNIWVLPLE